MNQYTLFGNEKINDGAELTPYLIEPSKHGTYIVKRGIYRQSLYGGSVRWTLMQECDTLEEAAKLVVRLTIGG